MSPMTSADDRDEAFNLVGRSRHDIVPEKRSDSVMLSHAHLLLPKTLEEKRDLRVNGRPSTVKQTGE